ncbi:MAG: glycosyltransferase [Leptonema sp. (in: Bacteria)]|nr:glycosyltransferase [Leptonema sp. (in: bacteria)]
MPNTNQQISVVHINTASTWRGGEQQVLYLAQFLQSQTNVRQIVAGRKTSAMQDRCEKAGIRFVGFGMRSEVDLLTVWQLIRLIKKEKINILHAHTAKAHSLGILAMKFGSLSKLGVKFIVSRRVDFNVAKSYFSRIKYHSPLIHRYIAISENVRRIMVQNGIDNSRISIAYSGIDTLKFESLPDSNQLRQEFNLHPNTVILGNIAALVDHKDQRTLLKAAAILKNQWQKNPPQGQTDWKLFIVGEGELRSELLSLHHSLQLEDWVIFTGFRTDISTFLSLFDIFVMSSKEEGLGTSVIDAMAAGLPVVTTDGGGLTELIVDQKGGLVSKAGNSELLALNLKSAILSPHQWKTWSSFNRKQSLNFDYHQTGQRNLEI